MATTAKVMRHCLKFNQIVKYVKNVMVIFLHLSVSHSVNGEVSVRETPLDRDPQTETPLDRDTPGQRHP